MFRWLHRFFIIGYPISCKKHFSCLLACTHRLWLPSWCDRVQAIGESHARNDTRKDKSRRRSNWICSAQCCAGAYRHLLEPTNFFSLWFCISQGSYSVSRKVDNWWMKAGIGHCHDCHRCLCMQVNWYAGCRDMLHSLDYCVCVSQLWFETIWRMPLSRHDEHSVQWQSHCKHYGTND